jgi:serine protein kinase
MEDNDRAIVGYFKHAAQGLEEKRRDSSICSACRRWQSSLAERLKEMMEKRPIYVLKAGNQISPVFESSLGCFAPAILPPCSKTNTASNAIV